MITLYADNEMPGCVGLTAWGKDNIHHDKVLFRGDLHYVYKRKLKKERILCVDGLRNFSS